MIERYALPEIAGLFTDEARFATWLEVEILASEAWAKLGVVPVEDAVAIRERAAFTLDEIRAREAVTDHETAAFVDVVQEHIGGPAAKWVHYGLTSYDVVDTAMSVTLVRACDLIIDAVDALEAAVTERAREHRNTPMAGRTHGIHAEPITFGSKLALWALQLRRDHVRLVRAREAVAIGKVSGAVGSYSNVDPQVEAFVCERLGLRPVPSTQVLARDAHAELLYACAAVGASIEAFALEVRHLQRTEVGEAEEPFATGAQKGSSAMPHKRNPWRSEQLCGLARVLRGNLTAGLENVALWHERDMSHSSVERIVLTDSLVLTYYMAKRFHAIAAGLVVHEDRMLENLVDVARSGVQRVGDARAGRVGAPRATTRTAWSSVPRPAPGRNDVPSATCSVRIPTSPPISPPSGSMRASISHVRSPTRRGQSTRSIHHEPHRASSPLLGQGP